MKACILIKTEAGMHGSVLKETLKFRGISFAFSALGRTDIVAKVEVASLKELTELVMNIGRTPGVTATETLIALEG
jgi:DNA-binding Lrp family transcriptional regulator